jgi:transposase-like protein
MKHETSIVRQLHRERTFTPPYCPRSVCKNHLPEKARPGFFALHAKNSILRFPYVSVRFRCRDCGKTFSASFFQLHYQQKIWGLDEKVLFCHDHGISKRATARFVGHDERFVRRRLIRLAKWGLLRHVKLTGDLKIQEPIVYDGLENFSFSQYEPNNINHAVGKNSLFTYDFNFCPLNRKGMMTNFQANRKAQLEREHGAFPRDAIRTATRRIFARLLSKTGELTIFSDRHFQYRRVVEIDLKDAKIEHIKISSKVHRNFKNPLFAVNNIDLQARHNLAAFKRETIAFSKNSIAMQESFLLYMLHRNYRRPKFWGTHRSDPLSSKKSPAMEVGITDSILSFKDFYAERVLPTQVELHEDWKNLLARVDPLSRQKIAS